MKRVKLIATVLTLLVAVLAGRANAQTFNVQQRTFLTFSTAVEMPGVVLPAGTYVFKIPDVLRHNVIQVWDEGERHMIGHWTFIQAERPHVTEDTVVMFKETREGATPAIQYLYFPGEKVGKEFIYPKDQAARIAARTATPVRTEGSVVEARAEVSEEIAQTAGFEPTPEPVVVAEAAAREPAPSVGRSVLNANALYALNSEGNRAVGTSGQVASELPRTGSPLVLSGLLALLSVTGAAGVRLFRS